MNDVIFSGKNAATGEVHQHVHPHWELYCCTNGQGCFVFEDLEIPYQAGDVIIIPPQIPHRHHSPTGAGAFYLYITEATLSFRSPMVLRDNANQCLMHLFADAHYLYYHEPESHTSLLPAYGHMIAQFVNVHRSTSHRNLLVEEIAQHIMRSYPNPNFDLDSVLKSAPYCYDYLCRLFRQEMHMTPHKYLANLRLQTAADILRTGIGKSITEIARMCGYHDPLYFSRMFKKKYGVSPREYAHPFREDSTE